MTEKEEQVYKILLTPIKCDKKVSKIYMKDNVIYTSQLYIRIQMKICQILVWVFTK